MPDAIIPDELGFADFAGELIEETFAAILQNMAEQDEAAAALVRQASLDLDAFAAEAVTEEELDLHLASLFPVRRRGTSPVALDAPYAAAPDASQKEQPPLFEKLGLVLDRKDLIVAPGKPPRIGASAVRKIRAAAARQLAAPRQTLVRSLVRQGIPRVQVEAGTVKAKLAFRMVRLADAAKPEFANRLVRPLRPLLPGGLQRPPAARASRLVVRTASDRAPQAGSASVELFGEVELKFRTVT